MVFKGLEVKTKNNYVFEHVRSDYKRLQEIMIGTSYTIFDIQKNNIFTFLQIRFETQTAQNDLVLLLNELTTTL